MSRVDPTNKLTYAEYKCFPNDGEQHEIIDGEHFANPAPSTYHQTISRRIQFQLYSAIELSGLGVLFNAPVDSQLTNHDVVQPDLVVVTKECMQIITPTKIKGVPDLIVEILSPSTSENDRILKKGLYQKVGVPEYWIVDPFEHELAQFILRDKEYQLVNYQGVVLPTIFDDVNDIGQYSVDLSAVWQQPFPSRTNI